MTKLTANSTRDPRFVESEDLHVEDFKVKRRITKKYTKDDYYVESVGWYRDTYGRAQSMKRTSVRVMFLSLAVAAVSIIGVLFVLVPLKQIEPIFFEVDKSSGSVRRVEQLADRYITPDDAIRNYFVHKYLVARETYDPADWPARLNLVKLFSDDNTYKGFVGEVATDNPQSLFIKFAERKIIRQVEPVAFSTLRAGKTVHVRFRTHDITGLERVSRAWVAIVEYEFVNKKRTQLERVNYDPLGFVVKSYRKDSEIKNE